ncbi:hypothetical protein Ahy_B08g091578 [Arachis hypogaea]|uniref:Uncharacterized protein n=1 Tax=Arachis hypogaea TaxID=3818 RepID=A0A444Y2E0_ARAHY|nr:hypothetical protein Ahy_B08g091578 [Arachis hypogaea]
MATVCHAGTCNDVVPYLVPPSLFNPNSLCSLLLYVLLPLFLSLFLDYNNLTEAIPVTFNGLKNLKRLELLSNKLQGLVPPYMSLLNKINYLHTSDNFLIGELLMLAAGFPMEENFAGFEKSGLIAVDISNNKLRGTLRWFMAWMPKLSALLLENNKLSGMIPREY